MERWTREGGDEIDTYRELRSLHDNDGLIVVDLDVSESRLDERSDVLDELKVEGISEHGL